MISTELFGPHEISDWFWDIIQQRTGALPTYKPSSKTCQPTRCTALHWSLCLHPAIYEVNPLLNMLVTDQKITSIA